MRKLTLLPFLLGALCASAFSALPKQLLGARQADQTGKQVGAARVGGALGLVFERIHCAQDLEAAVRDFVNPA